MKYDPEYLDHLDETTLKEKRLDAHIEYDKHQRLAGWSFGVARVLLFATIILAVVHAVYLWVDGAIPSELVFVTLGAGSIAVVSFTPSLKQKQLEDHIERINCALESATVDGDFRDEEGSAPRH